MTRLRWLVMADHVPPGGSLGGIVRYTMETIAALSRRDDVIVSATAVAGAKAALAEAVGDESRVHVMPPVPAALLPLVDRLRLPPSALRDVDVVHGVKHLLPRVTTARRVLTVHDMLLLDRPGDFGRAKRLGLPPAYRGSIRDADLLVCVSEATRTRLLSHVPSTLDRTAVVPLAASPALLTGAPREVPSLVGRRFALVVGDASPRKNLATLVGVWRQVRDAVPDAVLAIAGPPDWTQAEHGDEYDALRKSGAVIALGHIDDAELRWCYEHAATVLCPSLAEGFGLPAVEALELGAPVIISSDPALVEAAGERATAVLPARDGNAWASAIGYALSAPRPATGAAVQPRSWDDVADETVAAVARQLVGAGR